MTEGAQIEAEIHWEGDSLDALSGFPLDVKQTLGYSLRRLQQGKLPACPARSMSSVGEGVWELKTDDNTTWYRVMYLARIRGVIYVLHAFRKDSRKTGKRDIALAKQRLKAVHRRLHGEKTQSEGAGDGHGGTKTHHERRRARRPRTK